MAMQPENPTNNNQEIKATTPGIQVREPGGNNDQRELQEAKQRYYGLLSRIVVQKNIGSIPLDLREGNNDTCSD